MFGFDLPSWFVKAFRKCSIDPFIVNLWNKNYILSHPQIENLSANSPMIHLEPLLMNIKAILWQSVEKAHSLKKSELSLEDCIDQLKIDDSMIKFSFNGVEQNCNRKENEALDVVHFLKSIGFCLSSIKNWFHKLS